MDGGDKEGCFHKHSSHTVPLRPPIKSIHDCTNQTPFPDKEPKTSSIHFSFFLNHAAAFTAWTPSSVTLTAPAWTN